VLSLTIHAGALWPLRRGLRAMHVAHEASAA
jgi:hypothetical protein